MCVAAGSFVFLFGRRLPFDRSRFLVFSDLISRFV